VVSSDKELLVAGLIASGLAFFVALLVSRFIIYPGSRLHILDYPNERSLHSKPVPRTGGVSILAGIVLGAGYLFWASDHISTLVGWLLGATTILAFISFLDDRYQLTVGIRLVGHAAIAAVAVTGGISISKILLPGFSLELAGWTSVAVTVIYLVWMVNLYNFMDGMDGFAGGMAVFGFTTFAVFGATSGNMEFFSFNLIVSASTAGFLVFNFPPARLFMGDTGSSLLGVLMGGSSIWGVNAGLFPLWIAVLIFSPFIVDATVTLIRRMLKGERFWSAHKTHYYQRLVQAGWGHKKTAIYEYVTMAAACASAIIAVRLEPIGQLTVIGSWIVIYIALGFGVRRIEKGFKNATENT